jgi:hypothetical protein
MVDAGAVPFIPFRSKVQPDRGTDLWSKMFFYYIFKREEFLTPPPQAQQCRINVSDDQESVWRTVRVSKIIGAEKIAPAPILPPTARNVYVYQKVIKHICPSNVGKA